MQRRRREQRCVVSLDILAGIVRAYGASGFNIDDMDAAELTDRCDAWARHILTGSPPPWGIPEPGVPETAAAVPPSERCWTDLQQFIRNHRRNEQSHVLENAKQQRDLIAEIASGLRSAISDDVAKDGLISREMSALSDAIRSGSLQAIRTEFVRPWSLSRRPFNSAKHATRNSYAL